MGASDAPHSALFDARRLVLVAPRETSRTERTIGRHIVIGWKPGRSVEQTAEAALPWLRKAEENSVIWLRKAGAASYDASAREFSGEFGTDVEIFPLE